MSTTNSADFLVEIGTEELPPKALKSLMLSFAASLESLLAENRLAHAGVKPFASPRRLAALVSKLQITQEDREVEAKGPPVGVAFADDGTAKPAAIAFAKKCGVDVSKLQRTATDKGEWLTYRSAEKGVAANDLLAGIVSQALQALPIPRRMRWGSSDIEFVRPVHWVLMLHGTSVVPGTVLGHAAGNVTRGHRFMSSGELVVESPSMWQELLRTKGYVLADFDERERRVYEQVNYAARMAGGAVAADSGLYEEVAALTEWPVAMTGRFDEEFLELPPEVIIASLTGHQRYFPVVGTNDKLICSFVVVANLESRDPDKVRDGNERVIRPRLADAAFFWAADRKVSLEVRRASLEKVVYQKGLGSLRDKSDRTASLCRTLADVAGLPADAAARAAELAKCDLLTGMVGEFPELQGVMGAYYAEAAGEAGDVATAIGEQYLPRFSGDAVPASAAGQLLAVADKLDTLAGIFALGKKPSGNKDPFGLRRAALGVVRILVECELELPLAAAANAAVALQPVSGMDRAAVAEGLREFVVDRLRGYYTERPDFSVEMFEAVNNSRDAANMALPDFDQRIKAVQSFVAMPEADSLAAANKRISNILQQTSATAGAELDKSLLREAAEQFLARELARAIIDIAPLQQHRDYAAVLARLAELREPVDRFFDEVMVMDEDAALQQNRLTLLSQLREPFHSVAEISRLSSARKQD